MSLLQDAIHSLRTDGIKRFIGKALFHIWYPIGWNPRILGRLSTSTLYRLLDIRSQVFPRISDSNPLRLVWVDPHQIEQYQGRGPWMFGRVVDGEWDEPVAKFEDTDLYKSFEQRFTHARDWSETPLYRDYERRLEHGDPHYRCRSRTELQEYFTEIDRLYDQIDTYGYKTQSELLEESPERVRRQNNDAPHPALHEIGINIYRDGTLAKKGAGFHRLAIAKLLDLTEIPVVVRVRHYEWQAVRNRIRTAESPAELDDETRQKLDHPDLRDIVPTEWNA